MPTRFVFAFFALTILSSCAFIQEIYEPRDLLQTVRQLRDYDGPVVTVLEPANNQEVGTVYIFQGSVVDRGVKNETTGVDAVYIQSDSEAYRKVVPNNGVWSVTVTNSAEGYHTNRVFSLDKRGNASETNRIVVLVQASMPYLTVTAPASGVLTNRDYMMITGNAGIGKPYSIDKIVVSSAESGAEEAFYIPKNNGWKCIYTLKDGTNDLTVQVIADSGKTNALHWKLFLDRYAPTLAIESPIENSDVGSSYVLSGTVADNFSGVKSVFVAVDASPYRRLTLSNGRFQTNLNITNVLGKHYNRVVAIDNAGNSVTNTTLVIRANMPVLQILNPMSATNKPSVLFRGLVTVSAPSTINFIIADNDMADIRMLKPTNSDWQTSFALTRITNRFNFEARSTDDKSVKLTNIVIIYDTNAPSCSITKPASTTNVSALTYRFAGTVWDGESAVDTIYTSCNGQVFVPVSGATGWSRQCTLTNLTNFLRVFCVDQGRNVSTTNEAKVVFVEPVPIISVFSPTNNSIFSSNTYRVSGTASATTGVDSVWLCLSNRLGVSAYRKVSGTTSWYTNLIFASGINYIWTYTKSAYGNQSAKLKWKIKSVYPFSRWADTWGANNRDEGTGIAVDNSGNAYVIGYQIPIAGTQSIFIRKYNSSGSLLWTQTYYSNNSVSAENIAINGMGNLYIIGTFTGTMDFNPNTGISNVTSAGSEDAFLLKLTGNGEFVWVKTFGSTGRDNGSGITIDADQNIYIAGLFAGSVDFNPGVGVDIKSGNLFVTRLNSDESYAWTYTASGDQNDYINSITTDHKQGLYFTGTCNNVGNVDFGSGYNLIAGNPFAYIAHLNTNGTILWVNQYKTTYVSGDCVAADSLGNAYMVGRYANQIYVQKVQDSGVNINNIFLGNTSSEQAFGVTIDQYDNIYVTGKNEQSISPVLGWGDIFSGSASDIFLISYNSNLIFRWGTRLVGTGSLDQGSAVAIAQDLSVYVTGYFQGTAHFNPMNPTIYPYVSHGDRDAFIWKAAQ